jgi:hypothetical protein
MLTSCAMLWNTKDEDKGADEIVKGVVSMVYMEASL